MVKDKEGVRDTRPFIALLFFFFFLPTIASRAENTENGVLIVDFKTPEGLIKVFLPDDISAGDTVSAAIRAYPSGGTPVTKNKNLSTLNGYIVETSFFRVTVGKKSVKLSVPRNMAGARMKFTLRDIRMKSLGSVSIPISLSSPEGVNSGTRTPFDYQCPLVGKAGRLVTIKGPFDGDFATTDLRIGNEKADVIAESPRKLVFESPADIAGSVEMVMTEQGVVVNRPFTCLQVMKIGESGAVPESRSATGGTVANRPPSLRAEASEAARNPELGKQTQGSGMSGRALPPATHTLQFESIKAEETLGPSEPVTKPRQTPVAEWNEDKEAILTKQLGSPLKLENPPVNVSPVSGVNRMTVVTEKGPNTSPGESLTESPIASGPVAGKKNAAVVAVPTAAVSGNTDHAGIAESGSEALILEGQLLASFTEDAASAAAPKKDENNKIEPVVALPKHKGRFTVQVASYRSEKDADDTASRLRKKGYDSFVVPVHIPRKGRWYRVRVGVFPTKSEASSFAAGLKMKEHLFKSAFVSEND